MTNEDLQERLVREKEAKEKTEQKRVTEEQITREKTVQAKPVEEQKTISSEQSKKWKVYLGSMSVAAMIVAFIAYFPEKQRPDDIATTPAVSATTMSVTKANTLIQMRSFLWFDLVWSKDIVNVNDTMTISGKFHVFADSMLKPDSALLNIGVTDADNNDPVFITEGIYISGQLVSSPVRLELGETYGFKILLKARRPGDWRTHATMTVDGSAIYSPDKKLTIKGNIDSFTPSAIPVQANFSGNIKPIEMPEPKLSVMINDASYSVPKSIMRMTLTITNNSNSAIRLGEFNIAGMRFLDPAVLQDETGYPSDLLIEDGLTVSDNSLLVPGETRTVEITASGEIWNTDDLTNLISRNSNNRFSGILSFFDNEGNRQIVLIDSPLILLSK